MYLGSTVSDDLYLDTEISRHIDRAATTLTRLTKRVWDNSKLTIHTKVAVYTVCVLSTVLYGIESWTLYSSQGRRLNAFHLCSLRCILGIRWSNQVTTVEVLTRAQIPSLPHLTSLLNNDSAVPGHVHCMPDGRIPKDLRYGELASVKRAQGHPHLCFKGVCKRDMESAGHGVAGHGRCEVGGAHQKSRSVEAGAWQRSSQRGGQTEASCRAKMCSAEVQPEDNTWRHHLQVQSLQQRLSLPCRSL